MSGVGERWGRAVEENKEEGHNIVCLLWFPPPLTQYFTQPSTGAGLEPESKGCDARHEALRAQMARTAWHWSQSSTFTLLQISTSLLHPDSRQPYAK